MATKEKQSNKKKINWKKVFALVVLVALIVLKLMYDGEGEEDTSGQSAGSVGTESSVEAGLPTEDSAAAVAMSEPTVEPAPTAAAEPTATPAPTATPEPTATPAPTATPEPEIPDLSFRSEYLLNQHYEKHGIDMGFASAEEYEKAACMVIANPNTLHKLEAEDGDDVYYLESTNEFVVVSKDGYLRTYFLPDAGIDYYNRQ